MDKLKKLRDILQGMGSVLVAYSGGTDSTFLLKLAYDVLRDKTLAVTAESVTYPREELYLAKKNAAQIGVRHKIIKSGEFKDKNFTANPPNRCYFCKKELFRRLKAIAEKNKLNIVADGSNLSDKKDFRAGNKAKREFEVRSPLQEAGFTKEDIRRESKKIGLVTWDKPAQACLASRIPYGISLSERILRRVNFAEAYLRKIGIRQLRVRHHNGLCRIEVSRKDIPKVIRWRKAIVRNLQRLGYNYVTVDLEGYRTGSLNEVIKK
jgi:uncharacterized protein